MAAALLRPPRVWEVESGLAAATAVWGWRPPPEVHMLDGVLKPKLEEDEAARGRRGRKEAKEDKPEPKEKASSYSVGTKRKGRDGKLWEVHMTETLNEVWVSLAPRGDSSRTPDFLGAAGNKGKKGKTGSAPPEEEDDGEAGGEFVEGTKLELARVLESELRISNVSAKKGYEELIYEAVLAITGEAVVATHSARVPNPHGRRVWCIATCPGCERSLSILVVPGLDVIACTYCGHWSHTNPPSFKEVAARHDKGLTCNLPPWVAPDPALAALEDKAAKEAAEAAGGDGSGSYEISRSAWAAASAGEDCGQCINCQDKPKFGGAGMRRKACVTKERAKLALALRKEATAAAPGKAAAPPTDADADDLMSGGGGGGGGASPMELSLAPPSGPPPPSCPPSPARSEPDAGAGAGFDPASEAAAAAAAANAAITVAGLVAATAAHVAEGLFASLWTASGFRGVYRNEHTHNPSKPWEAFLPMQRTAPAGSIDNPNGARPEIIYTQRSLGVFADPIEAARALRAEAKALEGRPSGEGGERPVKMLPNPTGAYIAECRERGGEINVVQILKQAGQS